MNSSRAPYDVVVVGGGPSALWEALRLAETRVRMLVVSEQFGGCMEILGDSPLQSYVPELEIARAPFRLTDFMRTKTESCPTGREYAAYVQACFASIPLETRQARVKSLRRNAGRFVLQLHGTPEPQPIEARQIVLATGIRSKTSAPKFTHGLQLNCFEAYRDLTAGATRAFAARDVCIIGSGNTAFQLAYLLARVAKRVTILANRYVGIFPIETSDRFALRARSLHALELVEKTSDRVCAVGPFNPANQTLAQIYLHVYEALWEDANGTLHARLQRDCHSGVVENSLRAALARGSVVRANDGVYDWSLPLGEATVVSAIGVEANALDTPWSELFDTTTGFVRHDGGQTEVPGLYVTGSAAGYPSVNLMRPVFDAVLEDGVRQCSA